MTDPTPANQDGASAPGLTAALAHFAATCATPPAAALAIARAGIIDACSLMLAGRDEAVVRALAAELLADGTGPASVLLSGLRARPVDAAMINATATHALAMDDVAWSCHPSSMLTAALLALGEERQASGLELLTAYVVGYEVLAELVGREPDALHATGWHPTSKIGPVAVAAACGRLLGLDAPRIAHAMGMAASFAGGLGANRSSMTKSLHLGRVAANGVLAARLARRGVTAAGDALEGPQGYLMTLSPGKRVRRDGPPGMAQGLRILTTGLNVKRYPVCYTTHRVVDAAARLHGRADAPLEAVTRVQVRLGKLQARIAQWHRPTTPREAKYSVEFAAASGLVAGTAGFAQLRQEFIDDPRVRRLIGATEIELIEEAGDDDPVFAPADSVRLTLASGQSVDSGPVEFAQGHARLPMAGAALRAKFIDCAGAGGVAAAARLYDRLADLDKMASVAQIAALVADCDDRGACALQRRLGPAHSTESGENHA